MDVSAGEEAIAGLEPPWARLIGAMAALARPESGGTLHIEADPARWVRAWPRAPRVAVALAEVFGVTGDPTVVARLCQEAEHRAGVPVGAMDPLVCAGGRRGHAMLIDFSTLGHEHVPLPADAEIVVVDSGQHRTLQLVRVRGPGG